MRSALVAMLAVVAASSGARADEGRAQLAFNAFANTCLAMSADRASISATLQEAGWIADTFDALPRTPAGRHQSGIPVTIEGGARPDSLVFRQGDDQPWLFVHLFTNDSGANCEVYAAGVTAAELSEIVYPGAQSEQRRATFERLPFAFARSNGKPFLALNAQISQTSALASQRRFAYFSYAPNR